MQEGGKPINSFGLVNQVEKSKQIVQICFSLEGSRAEGIFIKNRKTEEIVIAHKGRLNKIGNIVSNNIYKGKKILIEGKEFAFISELPNDESQYLDFQRKVRDFIVEVDRIKIIYKTGSVITDNKSEKIQNDISIKKPHSVSIKIFNTENLYEIAQRAKDRIILINDICENNNKEPIFINDSETLKLWRAIEKLCTSEEIFINFTLQLYILIYETTRKENSEYKKNNGKPFYNYHLPFKFTKNGTPTKHFMDTVGALRHKFAHKKPEYNNVLIKKIEYKDVLKEIFDSKTPKSSEDFQKLQIEILKRLDNTLEILINIIENEYNSP